MGRKKKTEAMGKLARKPFLDLREETLQAIFAVLLFVMGVFLILAAFGNAGVVGGKIYGLLHYLFGYGYYFLCFVFFMLSVSVFRALERRFSALQGIGAVIFFLSALGSIELFRPEGGGLIGGYIARPLVGLFEIYATSVLLLALFVISFLITFNTTIDLSFIRDFLRRRFGNKPGENETTIVINKAELEKMSIKNNMPQIQMMTKSDMPPARNEARSEEEDFLPKKKRTMSLKPFTPPPLSLLERDRGKPGVGDIKANANIIKRTLQNFGIAVEMDEVSIGPSVTRYALKPAEGVKLSRILGLQNNLELALAAHPVRIEAPIPGKSLVGVEIPNSTKTTVGLGSLLSEPEFESSDKSLLISLGRAISGKSVFANIGKMPHLLIAGATGSGKSVTIHAIIASLLFRNSAESLKFIMIDPKRVELTLYNGTPHLLTPVITEAKKAILALKWAAKEMDRRYDILEEHSVRDIESYHKNILEPELKKIKEKQAGSEAKELPETMPYILIVIDELADIMQSYPREFESAIVRLAQMSRAVGIHLILSTQRPSVNVITGLIKANVPSRIALQVTSQVDSRTILDMAGAEKLLGAGDMLYMSGEMSKPARIQSAFISEPEVKALVQYLAQNYGSDSQSEISFSEEGARNSLFDSVKDDGGEDDELYEEAREVVIRAGKASTSYLQRKLGVGYARAARLMDMLEERRVVGAGSGSKPRDVLIKSEETLATESENIDEN